MVAAGVFTVKPRARLGTSVEIFPETSSSELTPVSLNCAWPSTATLAVEAKVSSATPASSRNVPVGNGSPIFGCTEPLAQRASDASERVPDVYVVRSGFATDQS